MTFSFVSTKHFAKEHIRGAAPKSYLNLMLTDRRHYYAAKISILLNVYTSKTRQNKFSRSHFEAPNTF